MDSWSFVPGVKNFVADENGMMLMRNQEFEGSGSSIRDVFLSGNRFGIGEEESRSCNKPSSSSNLGSSCRDSSSLIDLKLGRFLDHKDGQSKANLPAKKARNGGLSSQRPYCQVHGCRKDLSSSKDYHKRHKVCEIHSKTTKVIVNGVEQRFCQQCSRFHLLAEFDDGKRSCRKRLAGHNERRRKPHIGIHTGRSGRVFHSYNGTGLERSSSVLSSFVCQDILPGSVLHSQKYEMQDWQKALKVEDGCEYGAIPSSKGLQRHDLRYANASSSSLSSEKQYNPPLMHNPGFHGSHSHPMFLSYGSDQDFTLLDSSTTSSYGCALSLLSSQSQNSSIHSSGLSMITPGCNAHYNMGQVCEKLTRISPQNSTSTGMSNSGASFIEPILISGGSDSVSYGFNRMSIPGAEFMNDAKNRVSCEDGCSTIDLLQLSSQLQRVEHERQQSMKVKEDNNAFFGLRIT